MPWQSQIELPNLQVIEGDGRVLGIGDPSQTVVRLDNDEEVITSSDTPSSDQRMLCVTESGIFGLAP